MLDINLNEPFIEDDDSHLEGKYEPFIGQCFLSEEEAFAFYKNFAKGQGYSVRKSIFKTKDEKIKRRDFVCHRHGKQPLKVVDATKLQRNRSSTKCECEAHLRITLRKTCDIFPDEWHVTRFVNKHNHDLLTPEQVCFLPAFRCINKDDEERIFTLRKAGLSIRQILRVLEVEKNIDHGSLPFLEQDVRNLFVKFKGENATNDVMDLLKHCKSAKEENANFQYSFTVDEERRLEHIFWSPARCYDWYQNFGDVVLLDTTYKINSYEMPFAIFVGMNNHGKTILFGCALLRNETRKTFEWLLNVFVSLMGKTPNTILTDQDPWMAEAIAKQWPLTQHAYCIWHIAMKFCSWFNSVLREKYSNWCSDFYELYKLESQEEFERQWPLVMDKYNIRNNKHIEGLYKVKRFWVLSYVRDYFFGGMTTTGRAESVNAFIKRFISATACLHEFAKQVDLAIENVNQKELCDTMLSTYRGSSLRTLSPIESQVYHSFTPFAFKKFQDEFARATQYSMHEDGMHKFVLQYYKEPNARKHQVFWDDKVATCSCKNFEFCGIICRHILSVFLHNDCYEIPSTYLLSRWCLSNEEGNEEPSPKIQSNILPNDIVGEEDFVSCPPHSVTKGRKRIKRMTSAATEPSNKKQQRCCKFCGQRGHYISTCPQKENITSSSDVGKKKKVTAAEIGLNPIFSLKY